MARLIIACLILLLADAAAAQPLDLDAIAKQPGTRVIRRGDVVEIKRGGVTVTIDKDKELGVDSSGKAVLCYWNLAIAAKMTADLCYPDEFPQLRAMLDDYIAAANTFIAANSLRPTTKAQLEANIAGRMAKGAAGIKAAGVPPAQNRVCQERREDDLLPLNSELEKYRREFQETLKVPRPPVLNPCI